MRWNLRKIKEVALIRPPKKLAKSRVGSDDLVSVVPMECLGIDKKFFGSEKEGVLENVYSKYVYFEDDDVVIAKITPCFENGKIGVASGLKNGIGFGSSEFIPFRCNDDLCPAFLYHFMDRDSFRNEGSRLMTGAVGHKRIPKDFYEEFSIPIPPLEEQERIVEVLDEAFAAIDKAKANIERNLTNARELFQSRLNDIFSNPSEDWQVKPLGEICKLFQGLAINKTTKHLLVEKSSLPLLRIKDLKNGTEEQYVCEEGYPKNALVAQDDLIYTRTGSLGLVIRGRSGILHNNSFKVVPSDDVSKDFMFWWLQHDSFRKRILGLSSRMAQPDITHKLFKAQLISYPKSFRIQQDLTRQIQKLHPMSQNLQLMYRQELDNLEELRQSILEQAFEGKLTEPVAA